MSLHFGSAEPWQVEPLIKRFHYSRRMPANIQAIYSWRADGGLFGDSGELVAAAIFSIPPTRWSEDVLELSRLVRTDDMQEPLSSLLSSACQWLKKRRTANLVVSFADWTQGHHGGIYRAAGWRFHEFRKPARDGCLLDGVFVPCRSLNSKYGTNSPAKLRQLLPSRTIEPHYDAGKFLYWKPLHRSGLKKAERLGLQSNEFAACPMDELVPASVSAAQPREAAPQEARAE